jgi:hypothetical protein
MMDKVQKASHSECYTPSSEPFRFFRMPRCILDLPIIVSGFDTGFDCPFLRNIFFVFYYFAHTMLRFSITEFLSAYLFQSREIIFFLKESM